MRLLDATDDDALGVQAWGEDFSESHWVSVARSLGALANDWHARTGTTPWDGSYGPRALAALMVAAISQSGGAAVVVPQGIHALVGNNAFALTVLPTRLDLAAYDPDEALRALLDAALMDGPVSGHPTEGALQGALVTVVHHVSLPPSSVGPTVARYRSLPTTAVERRAPRGLRMDLFPAWPVDPVDQGTESPARHPPGITVLLGLARG